MEKEFVPYSESLELKQLGFDEPCFAYYDTGIFTFWYHSEQQPDLVLNCTAPLYQQAFRWFREKYNLEGIIQHAEDRLWYKFHISTYLEYGKKNIHAGFEYPTYEEAELACIKKLIEIVKTK
jgi:hypothetical protein